MPEPRIVSPEPTKSDIDDLAQTPDTGRKRFPSARVAAALAYAPVLLTSIVQVVLLMLVLKQWRALDQHESEAHAGPMAQRLETVLRQLETASGTSTRLDDASKKSDEGSPGDSKAAPPPTVGRNPAQPRPPAQAQKTEEVTPGKPVPENKPPAKPADAGKAPDTTRSKTEQESL